ncbi:helix-turn-helix transcriptional regulator [Streptomyces sp. ND04-05B]|uniref:helix-turn-helix domain-containing protein n=1 Tax=Streptomyces sp. ND04-05B TaxID=3028693 RepID=UPI0029B35C51|nr:helix-turn-helix transcriptional regulator [Streptomyces sp. ND04-05B]MDX3067285.1 helix-turn-helix transcriptional regulator [Streptomyces sp. ND04-05B]
MDANTTPTPPPEAVLLKEALQRKRLSGREAARRAGVSDTWWRNVVRGYQTVSGTAVAVKGPAETVARMAQVTDVTPDQLRAAGREDAAKALERIAAPPTPASQPSAYADDPHISAIAALLATLPPEAQDEVLRRLNRPGLTQQQGPGQQRRAV